MFQTFSDSADRSQTYLLSRSSVSSFLSHITHPLSSADMKHARTFYSTLYSLRYREAIMTGIKKTKNFDERVRLVRECRSSGLTDHQWCSEKGISINTFYSWVAAMRRKGMAIPERERRGKRMKQEIVRVEILPDDVLGPESTFPSAAKGEHPCGGESVFSMEVIMGKGTIRAGNGTAPRLLEHAIRALADACGGSPC